MAGTYAKSKILSNTLRDAQVKYNDRRLAWHLFNENVGVIECVKYDEKTTKKALSTKLFNA